MGKVFLFFCTALEFRPFQFSNGGWNGRITVFQRSVMQRNGVKQGGGEAR
jgi:hypothetical protein